MSPLVDHGVHIGRQAMGKIVGGDPHVPVVEVGGEWVLGFGNAAVFPVQTHDLHQIVRKFPLLGYRVLFR